MIQYIICGILSFFIYTYAIHVDGCKRFPEDIHPRDYFKALEAYPTLNIFILILCLVFAPLAFIVSLICFPIIAFSIKDN